MRTLLHSTTRLARKSPIFMLRTFCSSQGTPEDYRDEFWTKGTEAKGQFITQGDMLGHNEKYFKDTLFINFQGGKGGAGIVAHNKLSRSKLEPIGGDGGKGGDVYLKATKTNPDFSYARSKHVRGNHGKDGKSNQKKARDGKDLYYAVPTGTIVYEVKNNTVEDPESGALVQERKYHFRGELIDKDSELLLVKGGKGGVGNMTDRSIKERNHGDDGQNKYFKLEVKMIADIGLVGLPNAGKSSLIASITRSRPKIAAYAFTTINPNLGMIKYVDDNNVTIVDIPGLIKGASENKGLGHEFLKHCSKSKAVGYVIDMSLESDTPPWEQYRILRAELIAYSSVFETKKELIIGTKADLEGSEANRQSFESLTNRKVIMISSKTSKNLSMLVREIRNLVLDDNLTGPSDNNYGC